jgi:hypothetical protein
MRRERGQNNTIRSTLMVPPNREDRDPYPINSLHCGFPVGKLGSITCTPISKPAIHKVTGNEHEFGALLYNVLSDSSQDKIIDARFSNLFLIITLCVAEEDKLPWY